MERPLLIVGASARGAAMSARRSGFSPWAADLFADVDLQACCECRRVSSYPDGIESAIATAPAGPWMYVGALENSPAIIDRIAAERPLLGNSGAALRAVRDPFRLATALSSAGFDCPRNLPATASIPRDGAWLVKPFASAGGARIRRWNRRGRSGRLATHYYFQEFIAGPTIAAIYVANGTAARLLGVTWQLARPLADECFQYCGSIGPLPLTEQTRGRFERLGDSIAAAFGLRGLFGVDAILGGDRIVPLEVNPRYTASVEILERCHDIPAIQLHAAACAGELPVAQGGAVPLVSNSACAGKLIVYAEADCTVPRELVEWAAAQNVGQASPVVADIPHPGSSISARRPILTVFASGPEPVAVRQTLDGLAEKACKLIYLHQSVANPAAARLS